MTNTPERDREYRAAYIRSTAIVFAVFATITLGLKFTGQPRPIGVLMGVFFAANEFFRPAYPGVEQAPTLRRAGTALLLGAVVGGLIHLIDTF